MKTRKRFITVIAAATAVATLTACGGGDTSPGTTTPEPTKAAEVTKAPEPTEAPAAPAEADVEAEPAEVPVEAESAEASVEEDPNVIEGIDFTAFNEGRSPLSSVAKFFTFDTVRLIPLQKYYAEALIKDNDSFTMVQDAEANYPGLYSFLIYTPKEVMDLKVSTEGVELSEIADDWIMGNGLKYYLVVPDDLVGENILLVAP